MTVGTLPFQLSFQDFTGLKRACSTFRTGLARLLQGLYLVSTGVRQDRFCILHARKRLHRPVQAFSDWNGTDNGLRSLRPACTELDILDPVHDQDAAGLMRP